MTDTKEKLNKYLSNRKRHRWEPMRFERVRSEVRSKFGSIDDEDFVEYFKELESKGFGVVKTGQSGTPIAFVWLKPLHAIKAPVTVKTDKLGVFTITLSSPSADLKLEVPKSQYERVRQILADLLLNDL